MKGIVMKRVITFTVICALLFGTVFTGGPIEVYAAKTLEDYNDEYLELEEKLKKNQANIQNAESEIKNKEAYVETLNGQRDVVQEQIDVLDEKISVLGDEIAVLDVSINELASEIAVHDKKINSLEAEKKTAEDELDKTFEQLKLRLRASYISGTSSVIELLLTSDSVATFLVRSEYIKRSSENDKEFMGNLEDQIDEIKVIESEIKIQRDEVADKKSVFDAQKAELVANQNEIQSSANILESKRNELSAKKTEAASMINQLNKDSKAYKEQIAQIEADMNEIEELIRQYTTNPPSDSNLPDNPINAQGWMWPVKAEGMQVCSPYGMRIHPLYGDYRMHTGVDIDSRLGNAYLFRKPVVASKAGTVTYSGVNGGYGNCVIINHGGGYSTLYAHCDELTVSSGQYVTQGQTVGLVGTSGVSSGEHLHFEVRINGQHTNPMNYISL